MYKNHNPNPNPNPNPNHNSTVRDNPNPNPRPWDTPDTRPSIKYHHKLISLDYKTSNIHPATG